MRCFSTLLGAMIVAGMCFPVSADVLLDQPHDFRYWSRSDLGPHAINVQRGDDFKPTGPVLVESATFWMIASWATPPNDWMLTVHRSTDIHQVFDFAPEYASMFQRIGPSSVVDLGMWNDEANLHLYEVRFAELDLLLDPADSLKGTFWFSSFGLITNRAVQTVGWGTAGYGAINGEHAWKRWTPWQVPGWAHHRLPDDSYTDFAMRIEGTPVPVPGVMAPFALLGLLRRRRRR